MAQYAYFDSTAAAPSPVKGWYDTEAFKYPNLPAAANLLALTPSQWAARTVGCWAVSNGALVAYVVPPTASQLQRYANAKAVSMLAAVRTYTAAGANLKCDATQGTFAYLMGQAQWGAANPAASQNWIADDNTSTPITGAQFVANAPLVGAYIQQIYSVNLHDVLAHIAAGTITTTAQIDTYQWTS